LETELIHDFLDGTGGEEGLFGLGDEELIVDAEGRLSGGESEEAAEIGGSHAYTVSEVFQAEIVFRAGLHVIERTDVVAPREETLFGAGLGAIVRGEESQSADEELLGKSVEKFLFALLVASHLDEDIFDEAAEMAGFALAGEDGSFREEFWRNDQREAFAGTARAILTGTPTQGVSDQEFAFVENAGFAGFVDGDAPVEAKDEDVFVLEAGGVFDFAAVEEVLEAEGLAFVRPEEV
jgi:hypothetical protein